MAQTEFKPPIQLSGKTVTIAAVVIIALIAVFQSVFIVNEGQNIVVLRFGRYLTTAEPGLHFKAPFIDMGYTVDITEQTLEFGKRTLVADINSTSDMNDYSDESRMLTGDLNIIDLPFTVNYRIIDPYEWLFNVDDGMYNLRHGSFGNYTYERVDIREKIIRDICTATINRLVGDLPAEQVRERDRETISDDMLLIIQEKLNGYNIGVDIQTVNLREVIYPADVQRAIEDVVAAAQDKERFINEGNEAYNLEIPKTRGRAERIIQEAEGAVARFRSLFVEYSENPEIFRERYYYETMESVLQESGNVTVIDSQIQNMLPIANISRTAGSSAAVPATPGVSATEGGN